MNSHNTPIDWNRLSTNATVTYTITTTTSTGALPVVFAFDAFKNVQWSTNLSTFSGHPIGDGKK